MTLSAPAKWGSEVRVSASGGAPIVLGLADGRYATVYNAVASKNDFNLQVYARLFNADGSSAKSQFIVNTLNHDEGHSFPAAVALLDGGFAAIWEDSDGIDGAIISSSGGKVAALPVFTGFEFSPSIAVLSGGGIVASHTDNEQAIPTGALQFFDSAGGYLTSITQFNSYAQLGGTVDLEPVTVALADNGFATFWTDNSHGGGLPDTDHTSIRGRIFDADRHAATEFQVNSTMTGSQYAPVAAQLTDGTIVVAWVEDQDNDGTANHSITNQTIKAQLLNADGSRVAGALQLTLASSSGGNVNQPAIAALHDGRFVVVYNKESGYLATYDSKITAQIFNADGTASTGSFTVNTTTAGTTDTPYVSVLEDGRIVFGWDVSNTPSSKHVASKDGSYTQIFDPRIAAVTVSGHDGLGDQLIGTRFGDTFDGRQGNDKLYGKLGNDTLTGGDGNDKFVFDTTLNKTTNVDHIVSFTHKGDDILLDNAIFKKLGSSGSLSSKYFYAKASAHDKDDHVLYDKAHGKLYYDADGKGGHAAVLFAVIDDHATLSAADFVIV